MIGGSAMVAINNMMAVSRGREVIVDPTTFFIVNVLFAVMVVCIWHTLIKSLE